VPRIREIGSLQIYTGYLTFFFKKPAFMHKPRKVFLTFIIPLSAVEPVPYSCDFEYCYFSNDPDSELKWESNQGPTQTDDTGPDGDHTTGTGTRKLFLFCNLMQQWWRSKECKRTPKFLICGKFVGQNLKKVGQRSFDIFNNTNEIIFFYLLRAIIKVYYVIDNTLNVNKISKRFLVTSCFIIWELMSNCPTWKFRQ